MTSRLARALPPALLLMMALPAGPALAQDHGAQGGHGSHAGHGSDAAGQGSRDRAVATGTDGSVTPDRTAASREMAAINARMHAAMSVPMTGNLDADFVRGMIPHHQGAIDMAELTLKHSNDPFIRTLARGIIAAQRREITAMRAWLREQGIPER